MSQKNMVVTGEAVLKVLSDDSAFMSQDPSMLAAQTEFVLQIVDILGSERLAKTVSFASLIEANLHFHRYCLDHGMADKIAAEMKKAQEAMAEQAKSMKNAIVDEMGDFGALFGALISDDLISNLTELVSNLQGQLSDTLGQFDELLQDPDKFLEEQGATELQGLIWIGLTPSLASKCVKKGHGLTISDLLLKEPGAVVNYPGAAAQAE